jgi:hypothetical protein
MPRGHCLVCHLESALRDYGEEAISAKGVQYREIAEKTAISKSSWHRHMTKCWRRNKFYQRKHPKATTEQRVIVDWGGGTLMVGAEPFDGRFRESDMLLVVEYEVPQEIRNPAALEQNAGLAEKEPEGISVVCDETYRPAATTEAAALPEPPQPCEHTWTAITSTTERCSNCGTQRETTFQAVGVSRADYAQSHGRFFADRRLFGRFG